MPPTPMAKNGINLTGDYFRSNDSVAFKSLARVPIVWSCSDGNRKSELSDENRRKYGSFVGSLSQTIKRRRRLIFNSGPVQWHFPVGEFSSLIWILKCGSCD